MSDDGIHLVPYSPEWPRRFAAEKARVAACLGDALLGVEHIGSTAVPGLTAKPVIDLLAGVASMEIADACLSLLVADGWDTSPAFNATLSDRRFLRRLNAAGERTHHLHLVVFQGDDWNARLRFRDRLRANPALAQEYLNLKRELAARFPDDREAYTDGKTDFVRSVLDK